MKRTIKSDRELDALVAEHVMGLFIINSELFPETMVKDKNAHVDSLPHYSTDGNAMLEVLEKSRYAKLEDNEQGWYANLEIDYQTGYADAPELPKTVCLAALKAKGIEVEYENIL